MSNEILVITLWGGPNVTFKCGNWGPGKANDSIMFLNVRAKIITKSSKFVDFSLAVLLSCCSCDPCPIQPQLIIGSTLQTKRIDFNMYFWTGTPICLERFSLGEIIKQNSTFPKHLCSYHFLCKHISAH